MNNNITPEQIKDYRENGFVQIDNFLDEAELAEWRKAVDEAVEKRKDNKLPDRKWVGDMEDDEKYYESVFKQRLNLWKDNEKINKIMLDERIGKMAADLAGVDGIRIWHDQALIKEPWANATAWHLDEPFWSFTTKDAISLWVALDDVTLENGCLFFIPGSHKLTTFENPGITEEMASVFKFYPDLAKRPTVSVPMKAGSCSFHNAMVVHGAQANMTPGHRRAMTCAYMPDGSTFNGIKNILSNEEVAQLNEGDVFNDNEKNPLIYSSKVSA